MNDDSKQVTALIKELLILNHEDISSATMPPAETGIEGRKAKRRRIRQELVQALHLRTRNKFGTESWLVK